MAKFYRRFTPCLDSLAFANRFPSICFCSAVKIRVLPVFPSRYPNNGQSAREQDLTSDALSPEHCKQYERIAFNGVTMMSMSQPLHLRVVAVDQGLKVALQMRPAPLQVFQTPVHLGPVAHHHAMEAVGQEFPQHGGRAGVNRRANTVKRAATNAQSHVFSGPSLFGVSSIPNCDCGGSAAVSSS